MIPIDANVRYDHMSREDFKDNVYFPSDDTFLFAAALRDDFDNILKNGVSLAVEIGSGSGYLSTYLLKLYQAHCFHRSGIISASGSSDFHGSENDCSSKPDQSGCSTPNFIAVDINPYANLATATMSKINEVSHYLDSICMDMFTMFNKSIAGRMVDLIIFNPPYVPYYGESPINSNIDLSWNGGKMGREVIDRFIKSVGDYLAPGGTVYLLVERQNDIEGVLRLISDLGFRNEVTRTKDIVGETLAVIKFYR